MGKNLKGKELGAGISQRKDGRYSARFVTSSGKRIEKYFPMLQDARKWLAEAKPKRCRSLRNTPSKYRWRKKWRKVTSQSPEILENKGDNEKL